MKIELAKLIAMLALTSDFGQISPLISICEPKIEKDPSDPVQAAKISKAEEKRKMRAAKMAKRANNGNLE